MANIDLTLKPSLARYNFRPDPWDAAVCGPAEVKPGRDEGMLDLIEKQSLLANEKLKMGEPRMACTVLRRAYKTAEQHEKETVGGACPAARLGCAQIRLQLCTVLSRIRRHEQALQEARFALLEADGVWRSLFEHVAANQQAVTEGDPKRLARPLRNLLKKPPSWLGKLVEVTVQSRHCAAIELEFGLQRGAPNPADMGLDRDYGNGSSTWAAKEASAGFAEVVSPAILVHEGREFTGHTDRLDLRARRKGTPGGAMSIALTARFTSLGYFGTLLEMRTAQGNTICIRQDFNGSDLAFEVGRGKLDGRVCVAPQAIALKEVHRYLCTVTEEGVMRIYRDNQLMGEKLDGMTPQSMHRDLYSMGNTYEGDRPHVGLVADVAVWNEVVTWQQAQGMVVGTGTHAQKLLRQAGEEPPPETMWEEIDRLHKEGALLARRLLPDGHNLRACIEQAQVEAQVRREAAVGATSQSNMERFHGDGQEHELPALLRWGSRNRLPLMERPPIHEQFEYLDPADELVEYLEGEEEEEEEEEGLEEDEEYESESRRSSQPSNASAPMLGPSLSSQFGLSRAGLQNVGRSKGHAAPGDQYITTMRFAQSLAPPQKGKVGRRKSQQTHRESLSVSSSSRRLSMSMTGGSRTGGSRRQHEEANPFDDYRKNVLDPNKMTLKARMLRTDEGRDKLQRELREKDRRFTGIDLKYTDEEDLYQFRLFYSKSGLAQLERTKAKLAKMRDHAPSPEAEERNKRMVGVFGQYGVDISRSEPDIHGLRKALDLSQKRSGLVEQTKVQMDSAQRQVQGRMDMEAMKKVAGKKPWDGSLAEDMKSLFKTEAAKAPLASFEYEVHETKVGNVSKRSPHYSKDAVKNSFRPAH